MMTEQRKPCWETCGEDEAGACSGEPSCPDYRPGKPEWWLENPGPLAEPKLTRFEVGAEAMAKATIARI